MRCNPNIRIATSLIGNEVNKEFLFFDRFNEIQHWMKSAGLIDFWIEKFDREYYESYIIVKYNLEHPTNIRVVQVKGIDIPVFIIHGWVGGSILLIFEIIWNKFNFYLRMTMFPRLSR